MKFAQTNHPTLLFGHTRLFGTWEYVLLSILITFITYIPIEKCVSNFNLTRLTWLIHTSVLPSNWNLGKFFALTV